MKVCLFVIQAVIREYPSNFREISVKKTYGKLTVLISRSYLSIL